MSGRRSVAGQRRGRVMRLGRPSLWIILLGLTLAAILPAAGAQLAAAPPSTVDAKVQSSLHLRVISALNVVHDAVYRTLTTVATAPAEAQRLQSEATQRWWSGDILRAAIYCLVLLMIGADAEWLYWCYAGKGWRAIAEAAVGEPLPPARAATLGLRRAALSAVGAAIFICGVLVPLSLFSWPTEVQASVVGVILTIALTRIASIAAASPSTTSAVSAGLMRCVTTRQKSSAGPRTRSSASSSPHVQRSPAGEERGGGAAVGAVVALPGDHDDPPAVRAAEQTGRPCRHGPAGPPDEEGDRNGGGGVGRTSGSKGRGGKPETSCKALERIQREICSSIFSSRKGMNASPFRRATWRGSSAPSTSARN